MLMLVATSTAALMVPARVTVLARQPVRPMMMGRCDEEGFNSFRRWPSAAAVSLTSRAKSFFGRDGELTFAEMRGLNKFDVGMLDKVMDARPMADQRGEKVLLDLVDGHLEWITVV